MKVTLLIRNDHDALKSLFDKYQKPGARSPNGKKELFNEIQREILIHSRMEAEIFYPALEATSSTAARGLVAAALAEHDSVEKLLEEIKHTNPQDRNFDVKINRLFEEVNRHIAREEGELFDEARKSLPEHRLEELGIEMEDRRKILTQLAA